MKAVWNGTVIAESGKTIVVEGNHYFPADSIKAEHFESTETNTICGWKGTASYYTIIVNGEKNIDAAWYYPTPMDAAKNIENHIAFWKGVEISE